MLFNGVAWLLVPQRLRYIFPAEKYLPRLRVVKRRMARLKGTNVAELCIYKCLDCVASVCPYSCFYPYVAFRYMGAVNHRNNNKDPDPTQQQVSRPAAPSGAIDGGRNAMLQSSPVVELPEILERQLKYLQEQIKQRDVMK